MMVMPRSSKWLYAIAGSGVVLGFFSYFQSEKKIVQTAWTNNFQPSVKWDSNWDKRDYTQYIKSVGDENDPVLQNKINEEKAKVMPTARRHIFLIRHGQYDQVPKIDTDRHLTSLGRQQADLVGQRLKELNFNYTKMVRSTMTRALETSNIIHKYFPVLPLENCDLLREGAPIKPEPPSNIWNISDEQYLKDGARIESAFQKHFHRADVTPISASGLVTLSGASL